MDYSIIIPSYDLRGEKQEMFLKLIESIEKNSVGRQYEIIVSKNAGGSYAESHNAGLKAVTGEHLIILNDDVLIQDNEWLEKLRVEDGVIGSWMIGKFGLANEPSPEFACWAMSRKTFETIGLFDEAYKDGINFEDNDYYYTARAKGIGIKDCGVRLTHYGGETFNRYFSETKWDKIYKNEAIFRKKWNL